mgnify:FL=1
MKLETLALRGGYKPGNGDTHTMPIYQSTTYEYTSADHMAHLFDQPTEGHIYSRISNPTVGFVEEKIAAMEGGVGAMMTTSGQAASLLSVLNIAKAGDHILCTAGVYGGTVNLFGVTLKRFGIDCTFVSPDATAEELEAAVRPNTRLVFSETLTNPTLVVCDIEKYANFAHKHNIPLIVDNTFATPVNCRPFEWGADIVTHSTTKYMDGHGTAVGGAIVDGGRFDWMAHADKFPGLCTPDESYHGITYAERFGKEGAFITKCTAQLMRDLGAIQSPQHAFYLNLGLESLHVRMARHCENGQAVAEYLSAHPKVERVIYCGLPGDPYHALAQKYLPNGSCGVVSFELKGGRAAASAFMKALKLAAIETHVADARTCCLNPASSTHRQMNDEQLRAAGVPAGLVRMSCGLESREDLIADISQALDAI